ncbi:MAG: SRPBCC family protein [Acidimicrobiia bacterium]|nr:SRPBCC family protein [Acidimicrobiia bacterium]
MVTTFSCHGHADGSAADRWAVLADYARIARWARQVDHSTLLTEQQQGVGTVRRVQVGRTVLTEHVTGWDDGTALEYDVRASHR